jgi:cytochrome c oxidase cbb3-type subunit III
MMNEGQYEEGKSIYKTACAVCHGNAGEGLVGPNMTDDYWIHGGSIKDIFKVIKYGVIDKGMKPWKDDYSPNQIAQLSSYIKSMRGTNPPNPKEPQGELYKEAVTIPAPKDNPVADSLNHLTK